MLKRRIEYLKLIMRAVLGVLRDMLYVIERVMNKSGKIIKQPSGVPPMTWQRHKGRYEVAAKLHGSVLTAIRVIEQALSG